MFEIFRRPTRNRSDGTRLVVLVIAGYLAAWLAFGVAAHAFDVAVHDLFDRGAPLGVALITWGTLIALQHTAAWQG